MRGDLAHIVKSKIRLVERSLPAGRWIPVMNDFSNANYFPLDYDAVEKEFLMLDVKLEDITDASFLDSRMNINWSRATRVPETCLVDLLETPTQAMLFHTAFLRLHTACQGTG